MLDIISTRISQLRGLSGLNKTELATRLGVTPSAVSQWESGDKQPGLEKLLILSQALGASPALLQTPLPPYHRGISGAISFRATAAARTRSARERARSLATLTAEVYSEINQHIKLPTINIPDYSSSENPDIDALAEATRTAWGLGTRPILRLGELLESKGIIIAEVEFGDLRFDAFSCHVDDNAFIFLGTDKGDRARRRFDAAHELAHLVLHRHLTQADFDCPETLRRVESEANAFGSAFLLPRESFSEDLRRIGSVSLAALLRLKSRWGVSAQAMIRRARDLSIITQAEYEQLCRAVAMRRWRGARQEPGDDVIPPLTPSVGPRAIQLLSEAGIFQKWQLLEQIPMPRSIWAAVANLDSSEVKPAELNNIIPFPVHLSR